MNPICPGCQQQASTHQTLCNHCGCSLVENGELISALDLTNDPAGSSMSHTAVHLIWITAVILTGVLIKYLLL